MPLLELAHLLHAIKSKRLTTICRNWNREIKLHEAEAEAQVFGMDAVEGIETISFKDFELLGEVTVHLLGNPATVIGWVRVANVRKEALLPENGRFSVVLALEESKEIGQAECIARITGFDCPNEQSQPPVGSAEDSI